MEPANQDPQFYKLRAFYYNPNDKRLIVRSYFTDRFIFNYAKTWAWVITIFVASIMIVGFYIRIMGIP